MQRSNIEMIFSGLILLIYFDIFTVTNSVKIRDMFRVQDVNSESTYIDNVLKVETETNNRKKIGNYKFAGGMVSVDCLRCLCLKQSSCLPIGCEMKYGVIGCGYFWLTAAFWQDCKIGPDWRTCSQNITCSSQCVQRYMKLYAQTYNCVLSCEGYSRELNGGPNGCNNPRTLPFWNAVQQQPGCKGVE